MLFAITMGIGRFAYTAIVPAMLLHGEVSPALAGFVASTNLFAYLVGALVSMTRLARTNRHHIIFGSLCIIIVSTAAMSTPSASIWLFSRAAAGVASALAYVLGSSVVLDYARTLGKPKIVPAAYGGVGLGIASTGIFSPIFEAWGTWRLAWIGLGAISLLGTAVILRYLKSDVSEAAHTENRTPHASRTVFPWLIIAYGGEGLGYIIPATFLVAVAARDRSLAPYAQQSWVLVGMLAAPSVFVWHLIKERVGGIAALTIALVVQAAGLLIFCSFDSALGLICGAVTLGGTYLGVSAIGLATSAELFPNNRNRAIGAMTVSWGIGQIFGPLLAAHMVSVNGDFKTAISAAVGVIGLSAMFMGTGAYLQNRLRITER